MTIGTPGAILILNPASMTLGTPGAILILNPA